MTKSPTVFIYFSIGIAAATISLIEVLEYSVLELIKHSINTFHTNELKLILDINQGSAPWCTCRSK
jgi:hypothetical protein